MFCSIYVIIVINMVLSFINIRKVPRDLAKVNEWKIMFDPSNENQSYHFVVISLL